jgi:hypothetical protein
LKLICEELLQNFAFNFELCHYSMAVRHGATIVPFSAVVGLCWLTQSNRIRTCAWFQRLKVKCDEPLSNFAFNFNLRRYTLGAEDSFSIAAGRCM